MPVVLLVVGLVLAVVGLLTLGFGIPIKEFSLGSTLIVAGAAGLCSGVIVVALALALRELQRIAHLLGERATGAVRTAPSLREGAPFDLREAQLPRVPVEPPLAPSPYGAPEPRMAEPPPPSHSDADDEDADTPPPLSPSPSVPPWASEARRAGPRAPAPFAPASAPPAPPAPPPAPEPASVDEESAPSRPSLAERFGFPTRRDMRRPSGDWKRPPGGGARDEDERHSPDQASAGPGEGEDDAQAQRGPAFPFRNERMASPPAPPARPEPEPQRGRFDTLWPEAARGAEPAQRSPARAEPEPPPVQAVSVLKSGAVEGMNYTLYSDGSIEAQLPEGTVRFSSIDDLRAHLDQRDGR